MLLIGGFYLVPQLKGAGLTLGEVVGAPYWVGVVAVGGVVALNVALGGMRGITYVQAFQYWLKTFAIALPACLLLLHLGGLPERAAMFGQEYPRAPAGGLAVTLAAADAGHVPGGARPCASTGARCASAAASRSCCPRGAWSCRPAPPCRSPRGPTRSAAPTGPRPVSDTGDASPLFVYSLLIATFLGTMGLPHILVRFYTNRDGPAARRTTVRVLGLLGLFYAFPAVYGALGRVLVPELYLTGETDTVVLRLPEAAWPGLGGELLGALVAAGAFAAFMSTASGLLVSLAGTVTHDFRRDVARAAATRRLRFRVAALGAMVVPALLALVARGLDISVLVGWAFALAASTFCPLLLLGIWWGGLTARGAGAGLVVGAGAATAAIFAGLVLEPADRSLDALLTQPAVLSVPLAFATMALVSLLDTRARRAPNAELLALHAPEGLGLGLEEEDVDAVRA